MQKPVASLQLQSSLPSQLVPEACSTYGQACFESLAGHRSLTAYHAFVSSYACMAAAATKTGTDTWHLLGIVLSQVVLFLWQQACYSLLTPAPHYHAFPPMAVYPLHCINRIPPPPPGPDPPPKPSPTLPPFLRPRPFTPNPSTLCHPSCLQP